MCWKREFKNIAVDFCCKAEGEAIISQVEKAMPKKAKAIDKYNACMKLFAPIRDAKLDRFNVIYA